ncbi:MAG: PilW family protein [Gammaproteobacteria bacterium]
MNKYPSISHAAPGALRCKGFTLVELMIALLLGLILMAGVISIFMSSKQSYAAVHVLARLQENGRYGMDIISADLRRAGYLSGNANVDTIGGTEGVSTTDDSCLTSGSTWGRMIERRVFGLDDSNTGYACIPGSAYTRGDVLTLRYASPVEAASFSANRVYLRSSLFEGRIFKGSSEASNTILENPQTTRELVAHSYYIGPSSVECPAGTAVPALHWLSMDDNGQPASEELMVGAEHLQLQYGVDTDANGSVEQFLDADTVSTNAAFDWDDVIAVRVWLLVRGECAETGLDNTNTYTMGDQTYTPNDNFRRQLYTTTVMLRN